MGCEYIALYTDIKGWPEPCIGTVYDRTFGGFPAKNTVYAPYIWIWPTLLYTK